MKNIQFIMAIMSFLAISGCTSIFSRITNQGNCMSADLDYKYLGTRADYVLIINSDSAAGITQLKKGEKFPLEMRLYGFVDIIPSAIIDTIFIFSDISKNKRCAENRFGS